MQAYVTKLVKRNFAQKEDNMKQWIIKNYKDCWDYLKESKIYLIVIAGVFILTTLIGFTLPIFFTEQIQKLLKGLVGETQGLNFPQLFVYIFQNNLKTSFMGIIFSLPFGIIPLIYSTINGYVLGFVAGKTAQVFGSAILLRLLPHGIFELPALVVSLGLGLRLGTFFLETKRKWRGVLAYIVAIISSLVIFAASFLLVAFIASINKNIKIDALLAIPYFALLGTGLLIVSGILGIIIAASLLPQKEKTRVKENLLRNLEYSLKIFLFVVFPLLLIAGIIESALIIFFG